MTDPDGSLLQDRSDLDPCEECGRTDGQVAQTDTLRRRRCACGYDTGWEPYVPSTPQSPVPGQDAR